MFHYATALSAISTAFLPILFVTVIVAAFVILAVCLVQMGADTGPAPICPDCGETLEEGKDMALEDEWT